MTYHYDEELAQQMQRPDISPAEVKRLENRCDYLLQKDAQIIMEGTASARARTAQRANEVIDEAETLSSQVRETERRLLSYGATTDEVQKTLASSRKRLRELTQLAVDLRKQTANQDRIAADPNAEADAIFQRYPALQADRPGLYG
ncbi:hypothetical protein GXB85_04055 [Cellulomonas sp. APG4]|uniref:hypothetical protein n=1 Tax=Cellulomonas sp. APG4 TaxID=1538656 RepID=UPI001379DD39|nr:hypothetical protein [Cellulomonas sp. APG4]NCT90128.1 hypothetical protein [Cellulomonas sp. APG4]